MHPNHSVLGLMDLGCLSSGAGSKRHGLATRAYTRLSRALSSPPTLPSLLSLFHPLTLNGVSSAPSDSLQYHHSAYELFECAWA